MTKMNKVAEKKNSLYKKKNENFAKTQIKITKIEKTKKELLNKLTAEDNYDKKENFKDIFQG